MLEKRSAQKDFSPDNFVLYFPDLSPYACAYERRPGVYPYQNDGRPSPRFGKGSHFYKEQLWQNETS